MLPGRVRQHLGHLGRLICEPGEGQSVGRRGLGGALGAGETREQVPGI